MRKLSGAALLVTASLGHAVETTITVLGVAMPDANYTKATSQLATIAQHWPTATGTTIAIANYAGLPALIPVINTNNMAVDLTAAAAFIEAGISMRDAFHADIVIVFGGNYSGICGYAPALYWMDPSPPIKGFVPTQGLDLRGANGIGPAATGRGWIDMVATKGGCNSVTDLTLHEFGHLFGGGHKYDAPGGLSWLNPDSHAWALSIYLPPPINQWFASRTNIAEDLGPPDCQVPCNPVNAYSGVPGTNDNLVTLTQTAVSVANYRVTPPPTCQVETSPPDDLSGYLIGICFPPPWTAHLIQWDGQCAADTSWYEGWASQPIPQPYAYEWSTTAEFSGVFVHGASANVKVKACNSDACSNLSSDTYFAGSFCIEDPTW